MFNKKAIAALAAGATLLSGLAFAEDAAAGAQAGAQGGAAAQGENDDNWRYEPETAEALAERLNKEKAAKDAAEDNDKYEHSPFGNKDMDYAKCVKLYGKDALECKAVADYLKRHGQKVDDKANDKKSDKKSEAKKSSEKKAAPLAKTGAAVALAAVAASVLAGVGAALRKIRH